VPVVKNTDLVPVESKEPTGDSGAGSRGGAPPHGTRAGNEKENGKKKRWKEESGKKKRWKEERKVASAQMMSG
jgi:hypothetical protein